MLLLLIELRKYSATVKDLAKLKAVQQVQEQRMDEINVDHLAIHEDLATQQNDHDFLEKQVEQLTVQEAHSASQIVQLEARVNALINIVDDFVLAVMPGSANADAE